ncbi:PIN domain-containing protein [Kitasatospora xanthocidica]|uniref:PIN domain-containing protein n=1 Tax=Kitasatospora xanthocidica TaxID=83382 RepID=A0A372ZVP7_9ACTN|nr:type II toxin-antitoxin system VapC family toxin [Kitasatospora xanthocidica]RGD59480.1 PIN domain-containing protein [Kitasatospora xanthocidica]
MTSVVSADVVVDASAGIEMLVGPLRTRIAGRLRGKVVAVPGHFDYEVLRVLRNLLNADKITLHAADAAVKELAALPFLRVETSMLIARTWSLRHNQFPGDGLYIALAEELSAPLVTTDRKLSNAGNVRCLIEFLT